MVHLLLRFVFHTFHEFILPTCFYKTPREQSDGTSPTRYGLVRTVWGTSEVRQCGAAEDLGRATGRTGAEAELADVWAPRNGPMQGRTRVGCSERRPPYSLESVQERGRPVETTHDDHEKPSREAP